MASNFRDKNPFFIYWAVFLFFFPLVFLFFLAWLREPKLIFATKLFFWGTLLELILDLILYRAQQKKSLTPKTFRYLHYLNRSIFGLPFSIYLTLGQPLFVLGVFRFWGSLLLLGRMRQVSLFFWHGLFFTVGYLFYVGFQNYGWPSLQETLYLLISLIGFLGGLVFRKHYLLLLKKQVLSQKKINALKAKIQYKSYKEDMFLQNLLGNQKAACFENTGILEAQRLSGFLVGIRFLKMKQIWAETLATSKSTNNKNMLNILQHEWELQIDQIYKSIFKTSKNNGISFLPSLASMADETLLFFLEWPQKQGHRTSQEGKLLCEKLLQIQSELQALWENLERGRKSILSSGRDSWQFALALAKGEILVQRFSNTIPHSIFQGTLPQHLHDILKDLEGPRFLIDAACIALLRDSFSGFEYITKSWATPISITR